jgi:hypothetical protein
MKPESVAYLKSYQTRGSPMETIKILQALLEHEKIVLKMFFGIGFFNFFLWVLAMYALHKIYQDIKKRFDKLNPPAP